MNKNTIVRNIKNIMPTMFKEWVKLKIAEDKINQKIKLLKITQGRKRIILIGTPAHGNLGDHAIAEAEKDFFSVEFPNLPLIEIITPMYHINKLKIKKYSTKEDIIIISGGGWLGNLWKHNEKIVREVIETYPNNKIVIMPQTVYYEKALDRLVDIEDGRRIYSNHKNLILCLREKDSFEFIQSNAFISNENNCILVPDIVLYSNECSVSKNEIYREKILVCFRDDLEQKISKDIKNEIFYFLQTRKEEIVQINTVMPYLIPIKRRRSELENKYKEFKNSKIVITDRLHGMLFAAITGTPCIAFNNITGKVKGVYKWIEHLDYIEVLDDFEEFEDIFKKMIKKNSNKFDNALIKKKFEELAKLIEN